jgi:hypothetical protein
MCIVCGFLENEEFRLGNRQALGFQEQVIHVTIATAAQQERFDVTLMVPLIASITPSRTFVRSSSGSCIPAQAADSSSFLRPPTKWSWTATQPQRDESGMLQRTSVLRVAIARVTF